MNPDRVYREYRDDALAEQGAAEAYVTFVAQPFEESFRYRAADVVTNILEPAARIATDSRPATLKPFQKPTRAGGPQGALDLAEEIVVEILRCHIFVADLTLANPNVLLELGVALGLKPTRQIVLLLDGDAAELPFDIRGNNVVRYDNADRIHRVQEALTAAATAFEDEYRRHLGALRSRLSSDAIWLARHLGMHKATAGDDAGSIFQSSGDARLRYALAEAELFRNRIAQMIHVPSFAGDGFSTTLTALGHRLVENTWPG